MDLTNIYGYTGCIWQIYFHEKSKHFTAFISNAL